MPAGCCKSFSSIFFPYALPLASAGVGGFTVSMFFQALWAKYVTFAGLTSTAPVEVPKMGAGHSHLSAGHSQYLPMTSDFPMQEIHDQDSDSDEFNSFSEELFFGPKKQSKWGYSDHWAMA
jgi:hypothetical protein